MVFLEKWLKTHTVSFEDYRLKIDEEDNFAIYNSEVGCLRPLIIEEASDFSDEMQKTMLAFFEVEIEKVSDVGNGYSGVHFVVNFVMVSFANALSFLRGEVLHKSKTSDELSSLLSSLNGDDDRDLLKDAIRYVFNVCTLINNHINPEQPNSHKNDIRMVPYYPDKKSKRWKENRFSIIKVFGETKQYVDTYNRERRKYNKTSLDAVLVRGH